MDFFVNLHGTTSEVECAIRVGRMLEQGDQNEFPRAP